MTFTQKCELRAIAHVNIEAQDKASSVDQWDFSPGEENIRALLTGW